ncbi:MAG: metal-dependent hydrolase [Eggerthellaceae bacterium]|nr:metal-dependent hydrolase [Eggerthellaceae bacterium]
MMSKTHIAVGVASALAIAHTGSVGSFVAAVVGGSIGGIIADCDITPSRAHKDALIGRLLVVGIAVVALALDYYYSAGVCDFIVGNLGMRTIMGVALFTALTFVGGHTDHRTFTHSLVAMAAFCGAIYLICQPLLPYFAIGYASHLVLDITNHQSIRLFWPARIEASLGLCRAKGTVNSIMLVVGLVACVLLAAYRLAPLASSAVGAF